MKQEERTLRTKEKIITAAIHVFGSKGYDAGSIGDICRLGGINRGLLYHNYESKEELYLTCLAKSCEKLRQRFEDSGAAEAQAPSEMARQYLGARSAFVRDCPEMSRIVFEGMVNPPADIRDSVKKAMEPLEQWNRSFCETLLSRVPLRPGISLEQAMDYISMVQYAFNSSFTLPGEAEEQLMEHESRLRKLLDCVFFGIAKQEE
ncbi:MAG: TetR/AcrR family transcriptional regulator [Lachnospiraceae bacterium]|jgi:TetR/AcrR family transcriptional regulator